jgi:TorA maturation chaperone TorD
MNIETLIAHEQSRMEVYRLLADCYHLPGLNFPVKLARLHDAMKRVCCQAADYVRQMKKDIAQLDDPQSLMIDYARLFMGPYKLLAPPYGSVYLDGEHLVMGKSTLDARQRYRKAGVAVAGDFKEAPDHIAVELEFMHFLIFNELEAMAGQNREGVVSSLEKQRSFLEDHLGLWVSEFASSVEHNAATSFYQNAAKATKVFVADDYHILLDWQAAG